MATNKTEVANLALINVEVGVLLRSYETDTRQEAELVRAVYAQALEEVLAEAPWPWATKRVLLADLGDPPDGWSYRYSYPADCVAAREIFSGVRNPSALERVPYDVVALEDASGSVIGRCIVTDQEEAELIYTLRIDLPVMYPPKFVEALAWKIGAKIIGPLKKDTRAADRAEQRYKYALGQAIAESMNEVREDLPAKPRLINARGL